MVVHFKHHCNTYGSLSAYIVGLVIRLSGGEALIGLPALIHFPGYDEENQRQLFPFRTMAMLLSLITLWGVSYYSKWVFETGERTFLMFTISIWPSKNIRFHIRLMHYCCEFTGRLAPQYDYFRCVVNIPDDAIRVGEPSEVGEQVCLKNIGIFELYAHIRVCLRFFFFFISSCMSWLVPWQKFMVRPQWLERMR